MFYFIQRRCITNLKEIKLFINGVILEEDNTENPIELKEHIKITNSKETIVKNSSVISICFNLGRYIYEHSDILKELATNYYIFKNNEQREFINNDYLKRLDNHLDKKCTLKETEEELLYPGWHFEHNFKNINVKDIYDFKSRDYNKDKLQKYYSDEKLLSYLTKWFEVCGLSLTEFNNVEEPKRMIKMDYILDILDNCMYIYKIYKELNEGKFNKSVITISHTLSQNESGNIIAEKSLIDFYSLLYILTLSYCRSDYKVLKECEYCHDLFFGRKNKKCCSRSCKDKKNRKNKNQ